MESNDRSLNIVFKHSGKKTDVMLDSLKGAVIEFLEIYGTIPLAGKQFCSITGEGDGEQRFSILLEKTGYSSDPKGFFEELLSILVNGEMKKIIINGIQIPHLMLMAIL